MKQSLQFFLVFNLIASSLQAQTYPEMVTVEGGTFSMGDERSEGDKDEQPVHTVTLKTFKIAKTETTVAQWKAFCNSTGREMPQAPSWGWIDSHPIVNVNYSEAVAYCDWLAKVMNVGYRLPTEAEWEYAAKGGQQTKGTKYSGGRSLDFVGWFTDNSGEQTHSVATKNPNQLGLYDMSGNVWEWCLDWYGEYSSDSKNNPFGPCLGSFHVLRGGGWHDSAFECRVSFRNGEAPIYRSYNTGFRVVLSE